MDPVDAAKVVSMAVLSLLPIILGIIPISIARKMKLTTNIDEMSKTSRSVTSALACFGGGVLMATALVHLLPEIQEGFTQLHDNHTLKTELPLAEIVLCCGFFLVYLVEEMVHFFADRHARTQVDAVMHRSFSIRGCSISRDGVQFHPICMSNPVNGIACVKDSICQMECAVGDICSQEVDTESKRAVKTVAAPEKKRHHHHHHHGRKNGDGGTMAAIEGFLVVLGLSLHGVFEGMALGLEMSEVEVWQLLVAISSHKFVIVFCIGLEMAVSGVRIRLHIIYMLIFGLITPLGIGIGMALTYGGSMPTLTSLVLEGLAAGTLVYVSFFEILERERSKDNNRLLQWCLLLIGFLCMLALEALVAEEHDHNHDHDEDQDQHHGLAVLNFTIKSTMDLL